MADRDRRRAERALSEAIVEPESFRPARVGRLVELLRSGDRGTRLSASWAIGLVVEANPPAIDPHAEGLAAALRDEDSREEAIRTLAYVAEHRPATAEAAIELAEIVPESDGAPLISIIPTYDPNDGTGPLLGGDIDFDDGSKRWVRDENGPKPREERAKPDAGRNRPAGRPAGTGERSPEEAPPSPPKRSIGFEEFDVIDTVGSDRNATTYKALYTTDGVRNAATLRQFHVDEPLSLTAEFDAELAVWSGLEFEPIASVIDWGTVPDPWVAYEHTNGGSLRDRLGPIPVREALWIVSRAIDAVHYAHSFGVAHGGLSPANVEFVETFGNTEEDVYDYPKIVDWGIARVFRDRSRVPLSGVIGDAAPEQVDPETFGTIDAATDIYQLGVVAYEALSGRPPFVGENVPEQIVAGSPVPIHEVNPDVPEPIGSVIEKCLAKRKEVRYDSVQGLRSEFARACEGVL